MGRATSLLSFGSRSSSLSEFRNSEPLLPCLEPPSEKRAIRFRSVIGLSLYRRVFKWTLAVLFLLAVFIFLGTDVSAPRVVQFGKTRLSHLGPNLAPVLDHGDSQSADIAVVIQDGSDKQDGDYDVLRDEAKAKQQADEDYETQRRMPWLRFLHLDGYFHGLRALVNKTDLVPEYPNATHEAPLPAPPRRDDVPVPRVYNPYTADDVRPCYLDEDKQVPAPAMYAYEGVPQHMPDPALGSYDIFGIRDDVCFGRYGPYGLGYSRMKGGAGVGAETENSGAERIWSETGQIDYNNVDWGQAQERCVAVNRHRFLEPEKGSNELLTAAKRRPKNKLGRMAVVVRCYQGFKWTPGHPQLPRHGDRVVVEIRRRVLGASAASYPRHRRANLGRRPDRPAAPGLAHPTGIPRPSDALERAADASVLPGQFGDTLENMSGADLHGVYRSAHMPLQVFAMQHPEYEHVWNWEMDMRCLGNYYELFDRLGRWAEKQPRSLLWERNARYYIPSYHGTWENFTASVKRDVEQAGEKAIFGPVNFEGRKPLRREELGESMLPDGCDVNQASEECGVGKTADIITLNPIFDTHKSGWIFSNDLTVYKNPSTSAPPRRCAIVTAARLSRRLLTAMHETWRHRHSMFSEMFPPTVALHGLKAVYAPHPTYIDRAWRPLGSSIDAAFNSGKHHSVSGKNSPYDLANEHNQKGTTWYYHSESAGLLWRRWLGYSQLDGRGKSGGRGGSGTERGGVLEESRAESSGRMCLRSMLVHPIKYEHPAETSG